MKTVDELIDDILRREGGFVNDPDDPGGATNYGITHATLSRVRGERVSVEDVRRLTRNEAREIYRRDYFYGPKINELPKVIQASVFDMYVNAGGNGVRILQRVIIEFGISVSVDGVIGPETIQSAAKIAGTAGTLFNDAYGIARRDYYYRLADERPRSRKYAKRRDGGKGGWVARAEEFVSDRFHLSTREHVARTTHW